MNHKPVTDMDAVELQEEMETLLKRVIVKELRRCLDADEKINASVLSTADRYLQRRSRYDNQDDDDSILASLRKKAAQHQEQDDA